MQHVLQTCFPDVTIQTFFFFKQYIVRNVVYWPPMIADKTECVCVRALTNQTGRGYTLCVAMVMWFGARTDAAAARTKNGKHAGEERISLAATGVGRSSFLLSVCPHAYTHTHTHCTWFSDRRLPLPLLPLLVQSCRKATLNTQVRTLTVRVVA